jgi:hypothetical protein
MKAFLAYKKSLAEHKKVPAAQLKIVKKPILPKIVPDEPVIHLAKSPKE